MAPSLNRFCLAACCIAAVPYSAVRAHRLTTLNLSREDSEGVEKAATPREEPRRRSKELKTKIEVEFEKTIARDEKIINFVSESFSEMQKVLVFVSGKIVDFIKSPPPNPKVIGAFISKTIATIVSALMRFVKIWGEIIRDVSNWAVKDETVQKFKEHAEEHVEIAAEVTASLVTEAGVMVTELPKAANWAGRQALTLPGKAMSLGSGLVRFALDIVEDFVLSLPSLPKELTEFITRVLKTIRWISANLMRGGRFVSTQAVKTAAKVFAVGVTLPFVGLFGKRVPRDEAGVCGAQ